MDGMFFAWLLLFRIEFEVGGICSAVLCCVSVQVHDAGREGEGEGEGN